MSAQSIVQTSLINFIIDGKPVTVPKGTTVYAAAKQMGIDLPIFCYQDRMPPFGACRVCLVEVEKMPKLQTSCTLEATEGMVVNTQSRMAQDGRNSILEFLLINHPLDCPICDRGGECPLQDQTMKFGLGESRFYEEKRHFPKHLSLGPVLVLDRERCIACARCVRFGDIVAGDHALEFVERGYKTEVGTPNGRAAESKFIGNTIMICPVGALTSEVYRFRARPWDNEPVASTCTLCPVGCSMILDSRDGEIVRTRSAENRNVNDIWLCDKGWFGYEFSYHPERLNSPMVRRNASLEPCSWDEALSLVASKFKSARPDGKIAAFGGNPLTLEENYLFQKLMREGAGTNNLDHRIGSPIIPLVEEGRVPGMEMSIDDTEGLSFAVLLGFNITEEFPVIWLRLKQAINKGSKVVSIGYVAPEIAHHLSKSIVHAPGRELEVLKQNLAEISSLAEQGKKGAIFIGSQYLNSSARGDILAELVKLQGSLPNLVLNVMEGQGNSMGARLAGMHPELGSLNAHLDTPGMNYIEVLEQTISNGWDLIYVAGADLASKLPSEMWRQVRSKLGFLVVQDLFMTETARQADVLLPALSFVEKEGSFVNIEGRVQKLSPGKQIPAGIYSDGDIFKQIAYKLNMILPIDKRFLEQIHSGHFSLGHSERFEVRLPSSNAGGVNSDGITAVFLPELFDHGVRMKRNTHLEQLSKQPYARLHPHEAAKRGLQENDNVEISSDGASIAAKIKLDKRLAEGSMALPLGFEELRVHELAPQLFNGMLVKLKKAGR